jgi:hypothetical protein
MVLELAMPKVQAWERLNDYNYSGQLTMGEFETLLLKAGYRPDVAHEAAMKRGWDRLEAGVMM